MSQATGEAGSPQGLADQATAKVQETASELRREGAGRIRGQLDQRSTQAGAQARSLAQALRRSGQDLRGEGDAKTADLTVQAADRLERVGGYLEQKSGGELMGDIESFARRRPWMLAGVGMLAGVAAARFVKASSEQRYRSQWPTSVAR